VEPVFATTLRGEGVESTRFDLSGDRLKSRERKGGSVARLLFLLLTGGREEQTLPALTEEFVGGAGGEERK